MELLFKPQESIYRILNEMAFILNKDLCIQDINDEASKVLGQDLDGLRGKPFDHVLKKASFMAWQKLKYRLVQGKSSYCFEELYFNSDQWQNIPIQCGFCTFSDGGPTHVFSVSVEKQPLIEDFMESKPALKVKKRGTMVTQDFQKNPSREADEKRIREVGDYISEHIEAPLPPVNDLAKIFGMNREKLREGFKRLFHMSIYSYYTEKRLERAMYLLQHSGMSIRDIACTTGYNVSSSFYRAFQLKYKCAPGDVRKSEKLPGNLTL